MYVFPNNFLSLPVIPLVVMMKMKIPLFKILQRLRTKKGRNPFKFIEIAFEDHLREPLRMNHAIYWIFLLTNLKKKKRKRMYLRIFSRLQQMDRRIKIFYRVMHKWLNRLNKRQNSKNLLNSSLNNPNKI